MGSVYKIVAKFLASRLRKVTGKVVSPNKHAFVRGCQIFDADVIASECIDSYVRSTLYGVLYELHIEKAYEHVSWDLLTAILEKMGFHSRWRGSIFFGISTIRFLVLVNGEAIGFFSSSRGLREGDPLSPLLFIFVMETLWLTKLLKLPLGMFSYR